MARLAKHVGRSVQFFCEVSAETSNIERTKSDASPEQSARSQFSEIQATTSPWTIGKGEINVTDLLIIGIVHVSAGAFQVILQLAQPRN